MAYTNDTLLTAGMGDFPLGDLYHWFPEEYERWKAQENAEHARISHWLNTGSDSIFTNLDRKSDSDIPTRFELSQNYPNPFNSTTHIQYSLPSQDDVSLKVFNLIGQEMAILVQGTQTAGTHIIHFDGANLPAGVYLYRLKTKEFTATKKFILLK